MKRFITGILTGIMLMSSLSVSAYNILDTTLRLPAQYRTLSVSESITEIRATIKAINDMRANGTVKDSELVSLASQLYTLEKSVSESDKGVTSDVISVINEAEKSIVDLYGDGVNKVSAAIAVLRSELNIDAPEKKQLVYCVQDIGNLKGFYDLVNHEWARPAIENMSTGSYKGLFSGKTVPNENGLAQFDPDGIMTRAELITVVTRVLYSDKLASMPSVSSEYWYTNNYDVAIHNGLIKESEFSFDKETLNAPIPRQEMALILVRACKQNDKYPVRLVETSRISDINTVSEPYQESVIKAFSLGLIEGKDNTGRFAPHDTLTRAEGATVLSRLVSVIEVTSSEIYDNNAPIIIHEGKPRSNRNAKEGDIFIKKDGTQIVLKKDQYGILGGGQRVAPDVGLRLGIRIIEPEGIDFFTYDAKTYGKMVDSTGMGLQNEGYYINKTTGEGHWAGEWHKLWEIYPAPDRDENPGSYEGQVSSDPYSLWVWKYGDWNVNRIW